jgi:Leucine-rich repeat (LRR) protein
MLAMADLSGNEISEIGDISRHIFLETLSLRSNQIECISGLNQLRYLQVLDLSYNRVKKIEGLDGLLISELNLEGNRLVTISGLEKLSRLSALNISNNQIRSLGPLRKCEKLHNLNAQNNKISKIRQVEFLSDLQWLQHLQLTGNSCCEKPFYRARVVFRLSNLQALDLVSVSAEEKVTQSFHTSAMTVTMLHRRQVYA